MSKLSKLLHREIWSKRTTKIVCVVAVVLVFVLPVLFSLGVEIDLGWITPREHGAAIAALRGIESLSAVQFSDESIFAVQLKDAKTLAARCEAVKMTERDEITASSVREDIGIVQATRQIWLTPDEQYAKVDTEDGLAAGHKLKAQRLDTFRGLEGFNDDLLQRSLGLKKY
jgi:hypothetical protein